MRVRTINQPAVTNTETVYVAVPTDGYGSPELYIQDVVDNLGGRVVSIVDSNGQDVVVYDPNVVADQSSPSDPQVTVYEFVESDIRDSSNDTDRFGPHEDDIVATDTDPSESPAPMPQGKPQVMGIELNFKNVLIAAALGYGVIKVLNK